MYKITQHVTRNGDGKMYLFRKDGMLLVIKWKIIHVNGFILIFTKVNQKTIGS